MQDRTKSVAWILLWSLLHTLVMTAAKTVSPTLNIFTMVFVRATFGILFLLPLMHRAGWRKSFHTENLPFQLIRVPIVLAAMSVTYYVYRNLVLNVATSIGFSQPLIITLLALVFLKEKISPGQWVAVVVGYIGVLFFINPFGSGYDPDIFMALLANLLASTAIIMTKVLSKKDENVTIMAYSYGGLWVMSGVLVLYHWTTPTLLDLAILASMGGMGTLSQYAYINALKFGNASFVAPFEYSRLVIAIPIGYFFFQEGLSLYTMVGAAVIIASNLYMARNKSAG